MKRIMSLLVLAGFMMGVVHSSKAMPCRDSAAYTDKFTQYAGPTSRGASMTAACDPLDVAALVLAAAAIATHLYRTCLQADVPADALKAHADTLFDLPAHS
jgi:hypothetical protein